MLLLLKYKNVQLTVERCAQMKKVLCLVTLLANSALAMEKQSPKIPFIVTFSNGTEMSMTWDPNAVIDPAVSICFVIDRHIGDKTTPTGRVVPILHPHPLHLDNRDLMTISDAKTKLAQDGILPLNTPLYIRHAEPNGDRMINKWETAPDITRLCDIEARYSYVHLSPFAFDTPTRFVENLNNQ